MSGHRTRPLKVQGEPCHDLGQNDCGLPPTRPIKPCVYFDLRGSVLCPDMTPSEWLAALVGGSEVSGRGQGARPDPRGLTRHIARHFPLSRLRRCICGTKNRQSRRTGGGRPALCALRPCSDARGQPSALRPYHTKHRYGVQSGGREAMRSHGSAPSGSGGLLAGRAGDSEGRGALTEHALTSYRTMAPSAVRRSPTV